MWACAVEINMEPYVAAFLRPQWALGLQLFTVRTFQCETLFGEKIASKIFFVVTMFRKKRDHQLRRRFLQCSDNGKWPTYAHICAARAFYAYCKKGGMCQMHSSYGRRVGRFTWMGPAVFWLKGVNLSWRCETQGLRKVQIRNTTWRRHLV